MKWYQLKTDKLFEFLETNLQGLSQVIAEERLLKSGPNILEEGKMKSGINLFFSQFKDVMIVILLIAAIISGIIGDITDTIVILIIVVLNATMGFFQEYRAEKALQALKKKAISQVKVIRDGTISYLSASELVSGDIVFIEAGNSIPADLRIIESKNLKIDEATLTGESQSVEKISDVLNREDLLIADQKNMAFKGTFASYGRGIGVVIATGMQTELGRIAKMLQESETQTPLQLRMDTFGKRLSVLVFFLCIVFFIVGWLRDENITKMVLTSISLAVAAIPEALPAVITISLALAAKRMIKFNTLIRKLPAVETLGSVTYICTDKTGTLTKNKMQVEQVYVNGQLHDTKSITALKKEGDVLLLLYAFALNNDAFETSNKKFMGDSTEIALMEVAQEQKIDQTILPRLAEFAFDSERKMMTTFHQYEDKIISFTKGAPDLLIDKCTTIDSAKLNYLINDMANDGQRILGFAYRYWDKMPDNPISEIHETDMTFLGLASIIDPPKEEAFEAVAQCKQAGIVPVMITGDHYSTAKAIAQRLGIINNETDIAISGQELAAMEEDLFLAKVEKIKVYARVSPEQKLQIVKMLQRKGHYVAMTGDGVNDAPSLKRANIGIAMGIMGTDVSKEAAHMVLLDDNFSTIVKAIQEGRRVYDNILKFIKYMMTTNSGELWTLLLGPIIGLPVALLPIHILWINLVSDGLPAISLSYEKAEKNIMNRPPRPPQEGVFDNGRGIHMIWVGILMAVIALSLQGWAIQNGLHWQTIVFNVLCFSQLGHLMAIRCEKQSLFKVGLFSNKRLLGAVTITVLLQLSITYTPFLQRIFMTEALTKKEFAIVCLASTLIFIAVEIEKIIFRIKK